MILLFKRQPTGRWDDTGVGWKRTPTAGSYEALLATELSAVLPLPGLLTVYTTQDYLVGDGNTVQEGNLLHSILLSTLSHLGGRSSCLRSHIKKTNF